MGLSAGGNLAMLAGPGARAAAVVSWSGPMDLREMATDDRPREGCQPASALSPGTCHLPAQVVAWMSAVIGCPLDEVVPWNGVGPRPTPCPELYDRGSPRGKVTSRHPSALLAQTTSDPLVPLPGTEATAHALRAAGVPAELLLLPGEHHAHQIHDAALPTTLAFLARHLGTPPVAGEIAPTFEEDGR